MKTRLGPVPAAVLLLLSACSGGGDGPPTEVRVPVVSVRVSGAVDSVYIDQQLQLSATPLDASGGALSGRTVTWSASSDAASVSASGLVSGVRPGNLTITATSEGIAGSMMVRVLPVPVASLTVTPAADSLLVGESVQLIATARDAAGNVLTARPPVWTTSDAAVVQLSAAGMVTALAPGQATVTAGVDGAKATALITVLPVPVAIVEIVPHEVVIFAGGTQDLSAIARAADRTVLTGRAVQWSSANPAVATVSATGGVTGVSAGSTSVTAAVEGKTAQVPVIVRIPGQDVADPQLTGFGVTPDSVDVTDGEGTFTFTFNARDLGTGVTNVFVSLNHPANTGSTKVCSGTRVSGNAYQGTYRCTVTFPRNSPARTWNVDYVSVSDAAGNRIQLSGAVLAASGWPSSVKVTGAAPDATAPTLASFSFTPDSVNVANGQANVVFTIAGRDLGGTGIGSVYVSLSFPNNPGATRSCGASDPVSGTRTDGVFTCTVTFPAQSPSRTWNVEYISLTDAVGNTYRPFQAELQQRGFATTIKVAN